MGNLIRVTTTFSFVDEKGKETELAQVVREVDGNQAAQLIMQAASVPAGAPPLPPGIPGQTAPIP